MGETSTEAQTQAARRAVPMRGAYLRLPRSPGERAALEGSRCPQCRSTFYPPRYVCLNCFHEGLDTVALSTHGKVWTFTIARVSLPGSFVKAPYVIAQVELQDGVTVPGVLDGVDPEAVRIGMPVELVVEKVSVNAEGEDVMVFKFRPAAE